MKFNVIFCQYFKCKVHVGKFHCSNALELIVIRTRKQISGKYGNFSQKLYLILSQIDFDFWKSPKNSKCGNLWQKVKCVHTTRHTLVFFCFFNLALKCKNHLILTKFGAKSGCVGSTPRNWINSDNYYLTLKWSLWFELESGM